MDKKNQQVSQVTYSRHDMDINFRCPRVPPVPWVRIRAGKFSDASVWLGTVSWEGTYTSLFQDISSQSTIGSWFNSALHSSLEYFLALMMTSILVVVILAAYSFAVSDFAASIKYSFPFPPFLLPRQGEPHHWQWKAVCPWCPADSAQVSRT